MNIAISQSFSNDLYHCEHPTGLSAVGAAFSYHSLDDAAIQTFDAGIAASGNYPRRHNNANGNSAIANNANGPKQSKLANTHHRGKQFD